MPEGGPREEIDRLLTELRSQVEAAVREEQQRDQLTGLPNGPALDELIQQLMDKERGFWIAFFEIDYFKRVNAEYGYDAADGLLREIASQLMSARSCFQGSVTVFRPHGDEFFLVGELDSQLAEELDSPETERLLRSLNHCRERISMIQIPVPPQPKAMSCTMSVGWLTSNDIEALSKHRIMEACEAAVASAKRDGRNHCTRYSQELAKREMFSDRADCGVCHAFFTVDIPLDELTRGEPWRCPHCGASVDRGPIPSATEPTRV